MDPSWDDTMLAMAARQRLLRDQVRRGPSGRRSARRPAVEISRQPPDGSPVVQPKGGCACGGGCPRCRTTVPGGLKVGSANDRFEREADRVADQIMAMPGTPARRQDAELDTPEVIRAKALPGTVARHAGGLEAVLGRSGPGKPLPVAERAFFEPRFGRDLGAVRLHDDTASATAAQSISAQAFTLGSEIYLGAKAQEPRGTDGRRLLAHELTHVVQQQAMTAPRLIQRQPTFPDESCEEVRGGIEAAWPTAQRWVQVARRRLSDPSSVAGALQRHFKVDPEDPALRVHLTVVRNNFQRQEELYDSAIYNICTPPDSDCASRSTDGGVFGARIDYSRDGDGIEYCLNSTRSDFLNRRPLIYTLVHELAHLADPGHRDYAYSRTEAYADLRPGQAIHNADSYAQFAEEVFRGASRVPAFFDLSTGALLSSGRSRWAIRAGLNLRSDTGLEFFDLVGGLHAFITLDPTPEELVLREVGGVFDVGVITRSAETRVFADLRLGAFVLEDPADEDLRRGGLSASAVIGWADSGFRTGINVRALFDFVNNNNAVIIGGEFNFRP
jgi:hypothetical protein